MSAMLRIMRFMAALILMIWLGIMIGLSFLVAPELFSGRIEAVPSSAVAGEIMSPLLHKMDVVAWVSAPACALIVLALWLGGGKARHNRAAVGSLALLGLALGASIFSGGVLTPKMRGLRADLKQEFGGYDKAPKTDARRVEFGKLHGASMTLALLEIIAGLGVFYLVTQKLDPNSDA